MRTVKDMTEDQALSALLPLFANYYNINTDNVEEPFVAEAVFASHNEQYYLIKAAKVADINTSEYVYFARCDRLGEEDLIRYDKAAWERGVSHAKPGYDHRNTDVTLIIVAGKIDEGIGKKIRKMRHYKSWKFGFFGWSNYRLVAIGCSEGVAYFNHQGRSLRKLVGNIL
ncbi:MAG: hypothetical protein K6F28_03480 [Lachnospiraceae bacterium]|nr:hypothetical protein [Lachnospiraceae bacterium]